MTDHDAIAETIRAGLKWHDGTPRVSSEVLAALDSLLEELREAKEQLSTFGAGQAILELEAERDTLNDQLAEATANGLRLIAENERLRAAYESDEEAIRQARDYVRLRRIEEAASALAAINLHQSWRLDGHAAESYVAAVFPRWVELRAALAEEDK